MSWAPVLPKDAQSSCPLCCRGAPQQYAIGTDGLGNFCGNLSKICILFSPNRIELHPLHDNADDLHTKHVETHIQSFFPICDFAGALLEWNFGQLQESNIRLFVLHSCSCVLQLQTSHGCVCKGAVFIDPEVWTTKWQIEQQESNGILASILVSA